MLLLTGPSPGRPGGVATFVRSLAAALAQGQTRLHWELFATDKRGATGSGRLWAGLDLARRLRASVRRQRPALVHLCCGSDRSGWGLREAAVHVRLARGAGSRVLLHLHASGFERLWGRRLERLHVARTLAAADGVAVLSGGQRRLLIDRGLSPARVFVIPNGVAVPAFAPLPRRAVTPEEPLRLLLVGSVEERKGVVELLDALVRVRAARGPVVRVDVLGPSAAPADRIAGWRSRGQTLGLRLLGSVSPEEVRRRLDASDGLVLPSHAEGLPFVLLEALAASRPVLASAVGAIPELLEGVGDLVAPGSVTQLAEALVRWIDDAEHRARLAEGGWRRVEATASIDASVAACFRAWAGALGVAGVDEALALLARAPLQSR